MFPKNSMYHWQFSKISVICLYIVKGSNSSISSNSVRHKSFVLTSIKRQTVSCDP